MRSSGGRRRKGNGGFGAGGAFASPRRCNAGRRSRAEDGEEAAFSVYTMAEACNAIRMVLGLILDGWLVVSIVAVVVLMSVSRYDLRGN